MLLAGGKARADWRDDLRHQLLVEHNCVLRSFLELDIDPNGPTNHVKVLAQCEDSRLFEAERESSAKRFTIRPCGLC